MKTLILYPKSSFFSNQELSFCLRAPSSKSHSIRAIIFASLAAGKSTLQRVLISPDASAVIQACRLMGAVIEMKEKTLHVEGIAGKPKPPEQIIDVGNSGLALRFITALLALLPNYSVVTGDHSIRFNRPMQSLLDGLTQLGGFCVSTKGDGYAPIVLKGPVHSGFVHIADGKDSQPISALLILAAFLVGKTVIQVDQVGEEPWIDMTLDWLKRVGVSCQHQDYHIYEVIGAPIFKGFDYTVPGDFSSIAFPLVAALLSGISLKIQDLDSEDVQGDKKLVDVLRHMGAILYYEGDALMVEPSPPLSGGTINANEIIDAVPILAVLGCFCTQSLRLTHASAARHKESNRLAAMVEVLSSMGARIDETEDGLLIEPSKLQGARISSHRDHRVAMASAIAAWHAEGISYLSDIECIQKTYASFFQEMSHLGFESRLQIEEE